jgi:hypothetical protein
MAVVVVGLVAVAGLRPDPPAGLDVAAPLPVDWLPERLEVPARGPDPLPATGVVGTGVLIYGDQGPEAKQPVLLTEDGRQHRLAENVESDEGTYAVVRTYPTLSPDGRWLGEQRAGRYVVRDLTGTGRFELADGHAPVAWSPNSRWLLLVESWDDNAATIRLDLLSGARSAVPVGDRNQWRAVAVLPDGEVLLDRIHGDLVRHRSLETRIVDPASGAERPPVRIDLDRYLEPKAGRTWDPPLLAPDGRTVLLTVVPVADPAQGIPGLDAGGHLLQVDLTTGRVRRTALPNSGDSVRGGTGATPAPGRAWWTEPVAYLPEGAVLLRLRTADGRGEALQLLDPATGGVSTATKLPDEKVVDQVLSRGV